MQPHSSQSPNGQAVTPHSGTRPERRSDGNRPRLLSYVGRWGRARRWLPKDVQRVADIGCASGYGTAALTGTGRSRRWVVGLERDAAHIRGASHLSHWLPIMRGDASALPIRDGAMDAVIILDVLEHMPEPSAVIAEAHRILRPGGYLVFSVPHRGPLTGIDPMNLYAALRRRRPSWPPLEPADESATGTHLHFTVDEASALAGPGFAVDRVARTGLGLSEVFHLFTLVTFKALLGWQGVYLALRPLHLLIYLVDDLIPAGPWGYHLTVRARSAVMEPAASMPGSDVSSSHPVSAGGGG